MSTAMVDSAYRRVPNRKPVPQTIAPPLIVPNQTHEYAASGHSRTRTASSSIFPIETESPGPMSPAYASVTAQNPVGNTVLDHYTAQRTFSNVTTSTSSTSSMTNPYQRSPGYLQRSSSNASSNTTSPISYVALMRKQKATVWCERSQFEDPRLAAAQRAAKLRANLEVVGGRSSSSIAAAAAASGDDGHLKPTMRPAGSGTMGAVRSKIRHHPPKGKLHNSPGNLSGSGMPMRLSASEVGDEDDDEYRNTSLIGSHQRSGSGRSRSSFGSNRRVSGFTATYAPASGAHQSNTHQTYQQHHGQRVSMVSGVSSAQSSSPDEVTPGPAPAGSQPWPASRQNSGRNDYFAGSGGDAGSMSSGDREDSFGNLGRLNEIAKQDKSGATADELRRRGSVDERTTTMTGAVRLYVANPDLSD